MVTLLDKIIGFVRDFVSNHWYYQKKNNFLDIHFRQQYYEYHSHQYLTTDYGGHATDLCTDLAMALIKHKVNRYYLCEDM